MRAVVVPVVLLFLALQVIAFRSYQKSPTAGGFFLGGRRIAWWLIAFSFVATEISALTVIGVPALAYGAHWGYMQFFIGAVAARLVVAFIFFPVMRASAAVTVYGWLGQRFGAWTRQGAALLFFPTRLAAAAVRLMIASAAVSLLLGWDDIEGVILISAMAGVSIAWVGMRAVVFANLLQFVVFIGAGLGAAFFLSGQIEGGVGRMFHIAESAGRLDLWTAGGFSSALIYGFFGSVALFGTDQEYMQRMLAARSQRSGQRAMLWTIPLSLLAVGLFLLVGTMLFVFYEQHPEMALPGDPDAIFTHFALQNMTPWLRGWLAAGFLAASVDLPALSCATVFVQDFYRPQLHPHASERHLVFVGRAACVVFGVICAGLAVMFARHASWTWVAFKLGGVTFGPLLGVFMVGLLSQRRADRANAAGLCLIVPLNLWLLTLIEAQTLNFDWGWLVPLGMTAQMLCAWLGPRLPFLRDPLRRQHRR